MTELYGLDAFSPPEIARRVTEVGVRKARLGLVPTAMLGVLGGSFIALGALYFTLLTSDPTLGYAKAQLLGGIVFSLGLILVIVGGAELFTGNNLLVMAWADRLIGTGELLRNWTTVYLANLAGAAGVAVLAWLAHLGDANSGRVAQHAVAIATTKTSLPFVQAFFEGVLCNVLVCLAVWLAMAGRTVTDKILAIVFPISAFVAAGFEHSVANFFFIGFGWLYQMQAAVPASGAGSLAWAGFWSNLVPVTLGNIVGGSVLVGLVYHLIYRRPSNRA
jgi:formate/nitrite transporter